jgi:hypothetical protein
MVDTIADISNLVRCVEDAKKAFLDGDDGPPAPTNFNQLKGRLEASRNKFPPLYLENFVEPYVNLLNTIGEAGFINILLRDPMRRREAFLMLEIAQAITQNGEGYNEIAIDAFEEVCSDLMDGFLSAEDRKGAKPPEEGVIPPLVKFGERKRGPFVIPVRATKIFDCKAPVVSLPPSHARIGLLGWAALGHEVTGHAILRADTGLIDELKQTVLNALQNQGFKDGLPEYWSNRIDETASDVCGILNMGPVVGIAIIGYFRGLRAASRGGEPKLRNDGPLDDEHPADILRGYLAAYTTGLLSFEGAANWEQVIEAETNKDLSSITLEGKNISPEVAKKSAADVASAIVNTKLTSLENHALGEIQNWHDSDEEIVKNDLVPTFTTLQAVPANLEEGIYAAHVVAAAVEAGLSKDADISSIFSIMIRTLKGMHDKNPSWGPLFITQPGNLYYHSISSLFGNST